MTNLWKRIWLRASLLATVLFAVGCRPEDKPHSGDYDRVLVLYASAFNSLNNYIKSDIEELQTGYIPSYKSEEVLLVASKFCSRYNDYGEQTEPSLVRISRKGRKNEIVVDTLMKLPAGTVMADVQTLRKMLEYVGDEFPSKSYGMIFSSHATGWLPEGYFSNPSAFENGNASVSGRRRNGGELTPYYEVERDPSLPAVRTVGQEVVLKNGKKYTREMEIDGFAAAIPMHLDYLLFDACLMGGVEVAYALRNTADYVGFSQAEVLADGFDYSTVVSRLLLESPAAPQKVCEDFFDTYDRKSGQERSATISFVDCRKLGNLTAVCQELFDKYSPWFMIMDPTKVQEYFYDSSKHWHYDLYDIVAKVIAQVGGDEEDLVALKQAIDECVVYKAATPNFFGVPINCHSGLSMYLPANGSQYLNNYYKTLSWNEATGLVE